jgi:PAS domain S-box-containing protein
MARSSSSSSRSKPARRRAAARPRKREAKTARPPEPHEYGRLVADLSVYQEEATQQYEQLLETQRILEESRDRYAELYDMAPIGYFTLDHNGVIEEVNLTGTTMVGMERRRLIGLPLLSFLEASSRNEFLSHVLRCRRHLITTTSELTLRPRTGRPMPIQLSSRCAGGTRIHSAMTDLTDLQQAHEQVRQYQSRLRTLAVELSRAEERERRRIATALHDHLGQYLALAKIKLGTLRKTNGHGGVVAEVQDLLNQAITESRRITLELSPPVLYAFGLDAAIEWLIEQNRRYGLHMELRAASRSLVLPEHVKVLLFQAVRELLINIVKHAQATKASIYLGRAGGEVEIVVEDDGVGIDLEALARPPSAAGGFGLFSLRTRIEHIGGVLEIQRRIGSGTRARVAVPLGLSEQATHEQPNPEQPNHDQPIEDHSNDSTHDQDENPAGG